MTETETLNIQINFLAESGHCLSVDSAIWLPRV